MRTPHGANFSALSRKRLLRVVALLDRVALLDNLSFSCQPSLRVQYWPCPVNVVLRLSWLPPSACRYIHCECMSRCTPLAVLAACAPFRNCELTVTNGMCLVAP